MAKNKQLKVRISDEFQQLLASAWRHLPKQTKTKGINSQSDFVINALLVYISSSKDGKNFIKEYGKDIEEIEWWQNKESMDKQKKKENAEWIEEYFANRKKK